MHKANQLVAVQEHPGPARLPAKHVLDVFLKRIVLIGKGNQLVAAGMGKHA